MKVYRLTTLDNPFDPFDQYEEWNTFDEMHGYYTAGLMARFCVNSPAFSAEESVEADKEAIDKIMSYNFTGNLKVVTREYPDS